MKSNKLFLLAGILLVSVSCEALTSSSSSESISSSSSETVNFTKNDYGEMFGNFYSSNITLSIEENQARLDFSTDSLILKPTKKTSFSLESVSFNVNYTVDAFVYETLDSSRIFRAYIPHETNSWLVLEEKNGLSWKLVEEFQPIFSEFLGTWNSSPSGLDNNYVFTDEYIDDVNVFKAEILTYGTPVAYYYQNYYVFEDIDTMHHEVYMVDSDYEEWLSFYVSEKSEDGAPLVLNDTSFNAPYLLPSHKYYLGEFYSTNGSINLTFDEENKTMVFGETVYNYQVKFTEAGYIIELNNETSSGKLISFYGGFYFDDGTTKIEYVRANYGLLEGTWYFDGSIIDFNLDEETWEEYVLKIDDQITTYTILAKDRQFAIKFNLGGTECVMTALLEDISVTITKGEKEYYAANYQYFTSIFVDTTYAIKSDKVTTMTISEDLYVVFDSKRTKGDYFFDLATNTICYSFKIDNKEYSCYLLEEGIFYVPFGSEENDYYIFCTESTLKAFEGEWTTGGITAEVIINMNLVSPTISHGNYTSSLSFDYFTDTGLTMIYESAKGQIGLGGMITGSFVEYSIKDDIAVINEYYIHVDDFKKLVGTYVLDGANGLEYIVINEDGTFQITGNKYDADGNVIGTELQTYETYFSYMEDWYGYRYVALAFYDPITNISVYCQFNGTYFTLFGSLNYYAESLYQKFGVYKDPNSSNCFTMFSDKVTFNDSDGSITAVSVQGEETIVTFSVMGSVYNAVFTDDSIHITGIDTDVTYQKQEFDISKFFGTWTINEIEYSLENKKNEITGANVPTFTFDTTSLTDYKVQYDENGHMQLVFVNFFTTYTITLDTEGPILVVEDSSPLPPPPPPPPLS